ncbi:MAG TPA: NAD(P)-dependent oxidoreductase [Saprospiraceae bacterium]|nr:NAD(P)-dependent oxidoreductase [Saprospiraceae bacterium]HND87115.1 NAD(P)-dependent oxidoreductase [Saprospiraceae bacterium]
MIKIGIIREGKVPPDARVPLTPEQCAEAQVEFPVKFLVEPSPVRCFPDEEYAEHGVMLSHDLSDCDVLLGVKEVPIDTLMPGKTYLFFSHTIKKQPYNRPLLQAILEKGIRLIDYEVLTDERGQRLIAFGFYAGVVGAHNGLWTYGRRTGLFSLPRLYESHDYASVQQVYQSLRLPPLRIVLTGTGRVSSGAAKNLRDMGIRQVSPQEFLEKEFAEAVFTQLQAEHYVERKDGQPFEKADFYRNSAAYRSTFMPYARRADIFINGIFYDGQAPAFFTRQEMASPDFRIQTIADITCDMMPCSSVPSTIRPSKIADPVYGFDPASGQEVPLFSPGSVDVMAIDNLPSELPRDASAFFGRQLLGAIFPELLRGKDSTVIRRGMIAEQGHLTEAFAHLEGYVKGEAG